MGIRVTITESIIAKVISARSQGMLMVGTDNKSDWNSKIYKTLHERREFDKASHMKNEHMVLHKMILMCFLPRE